jgi:hypothetical protein
VSIPSTDVWRCVHLDQGLKGEGKAISIEKERGGKLEMAKGAGRPVWSVCAHRKQKEM